MLGLCNKSQICTTATTTSLQFLSGTSLAGAPFPERSFMKVSFSVISGLKSPATKLSTMPCLACTQIAGRKGKTLQEWTQHWEQIVCWVCMLGLYVRWVQQHRDWVLKRQTKAKGLAQRPALVRNLCACYSRIRCKGMCVKVETLCGRDNSQLSLQGQISSSCKSHCKPISVQTRGSACVGTFGEISGAPSTDILGHLNYFWALTDVKCRRGDLCMVTGWEMVKEYWVVSYSEAQRFHQHSGCRAGGERPAYAKASKQTSYTQSLVRKFAVNLRGIEVEQAHRRCFSNFH